MTKEEALEIIKTLSGVESYIMALEENRSLPDYLLDKIAENIDVLQGVVLDEETK